METERVPACPVCGDERRELLHAELADRLYGAPGRWRLQRCAGCGAGYLDPRPTPESIGGAYEAYYTHEVTSPAGAPDSLPRRLRNGYLNARYGYELRPAMPLGRFVVPLLPGRRAAADRHVRGLRRPRAGARVLDVGCGNGDFLLELRAGGWVAEGLESDARAAALARAQGLDVRDGTLEEDTYPAGSFDAVTMSHVLEHLHDPVGTLQVAREVLRDDGVLWIATPNLASPGHARYGRAWRGLEPPRHLVLFTPSALVTALDRAGFGAVSFARPASARWIYDASAELAGGTRSPPRLAIAADLRGALRHDRGEELVAVARPG